jgi:hypothetical protein
MESEKESKSKENNKHGGAGRNQGDKKLCCKHVANESIFPRLTSFFQPAAKNDSTPKHANGKRPRDTSGGSTERMRPPKSSKMSSFLPAVEPQDVAPAAKSYLLGKGGIIAQALSELSKGNHLLRASPCLM